MKPIITLGLQAALLLPVVLAVPVHHRTASENIQVATTSGKLNGFINSTNPDVYQFLGVPFAEPPVGPLRWLPPVALNASEQTFNATAFSPSCPQYLATSHSLYNDYGREYLIYGPTSEDCLTVSVWAPVNPTNASLPVVIYIYGGAFQTGGSSVPYQDPAAWVQRSQSHIVVGLQYRLNIFGFPAAAGLEDQNLGLLDQRMAIEWAQSNVAQFGGDPERMILWGQSAGGESVDLQNFAHYDDPIVTGFIQDSGTVFVNLITRSSSYSQFDTVADYFNCSSSDALVQLSCMRNVSTADLVEVVGSGTLGVSFFPYADEKVVFSNYTERYLNGKVSDRPAIFGSNSLEGVAFVAYPDDPTTTSPDQTAADEITLENFQCAAALTAKYRAQLGLTTFRYQYRGNFSNISPLPWMGAYHSSELPLIFGTSADGGPDSSLETAVSETMQDFWLAFARDPAAGVTQNGGWKPYSDGVVEVFANATASGDDAVVHSVPYEEIDAVCAGAMEALLIAGKNFV